MTLSQEDFNTIVRLTSLVSIDLIIRNSKGQILLGRRNNQPAKGSWFVPGGRIKKGDDLSKAFLEISEKELGIEIGLNEAEFLNVFSHSYTTNAAEEDGYGTHYIVLAYQVGYELDTASLPTDQHRDWKWSCVDDVDSCEDVHQYVKDYCSLLGGNPASFSGDSPAGPLQYQLVAARRQGTDAMLWQTPAISLAAQAFLLAIVLNPTAESFTRSLAAILAIVTALVSFHLMHKHRHFELKDAHYLRGFEILHHSSKGYRLLHGKPSYPGGWRSRLVRVSAYVVWQCVLLLFAVAAALAWFVSGNIKATVSAEDVVAPSCAVSQDRK